MIRGTTDTGLLTPPAPGRPSPQATQPPLASPHTSPGAELRPAESDSAPDIVPRWVKESVAAFIAVVLVGCLVFMIRQAFQSLGSAQSDPSFDRVKDLLLFINPLVGVVIGYYFNRVSTEARAESAERTAQGATATALRAEAALGEAQARAQANRSEANEARAALAEIIPAAQAVLSPPPLPQARGEAAGNNTTESLAGARTSLLVALERARAVAGRRGGEFRLGE